MRISSRSVTSLACRFLFDRTAALAASAAQKLPTTSDGASLPAVVVEAPKQSARPQKREPRAIARSTVSSPDIAKPLQRLDVADIRQARQACERHGQLRRRLRDELQVRRRPVAWMFYFRWRALFDVQKHTQLQNLQRVHGGRPDTRLEKRRSRMGLHQPGAKVTRPRRMG